LIEQQADKRKYEVTMKHAHITICNLICVSTSLAMPHGDNPWQEPIIPDPYGQAKTPCERARAHARTSLGGAAIECEADGSYSPVRCQLYRGRRECWCVTDDGKQVEGTRGRAGDAKPDCSAYRKPGNTNIRQSVDPDLAKAVADLTGKEAPIADAAGEVEKNPSAVVDQREREKRDLPEELSDQPATCIEKIRFLEAKISSLNKEVFALKSLIDSLRTTAQPTGETA